tara:strand:- start:419 stop:1093 length:675 start_codon:yes stop_codon:yes gene_type:complete
MFGRDQKVLERAHKARSVADILMATPRVEPQPPEEPSALELTRKYAVRDGLTPAGREHRERVAAVLQRQATWPTQAMVDAGFLWVVDGSFVTRFKFAAEALSAKQYHGSLVRRDSHRDIHYVGDIPEVALDRIQKAQELGLKTYAMAALGSSFSATHKSMMPKEWFKSEHTHVAVEDAIEQGELFFAIRRHIETMRGKADDVDHIMAEAERARLRCLRSNNLPI